MLIPGIAGAFAFFYAVIAMKTIWFAVPIASILALSVLAFQEAKLTDTVWWGCMLPALFVLALWKYRVLRLQDSQCSIPGFPFVVVDQNRTLGNIGKSQLRWISGALKQLVSNVSSILDRFLHRSELFQLMGRSYRLGSSKNNSKGAKALTGSDADTKTVDKASKAAMS